MNFKDYYKILNVSEDADKKAIKKAYLALAKKYHPDVNKSTDAEEKFKEVREAYDVLKDPAKKEEYDEIRKYGGANQEFTPPPNWGSSKSHHQDFTGHHDYSDFFDSIFRRSKEDFQQPGSDFEIELPIFLEALVKNDKQKLSFEIPKILPNGQRELEKKNIEITIPKGTLDGDKIRLKGQGGYGVNSPKRGDLYVTIKLVPHPLFDVANKIDLEITVPIAPWETVLGSQIEIPTLTSKIKLNIKPKSDIKNKIRVPGKGLPSKNSVGDLFINLKVVTPLQTSEEEDKLWKKLSDISNFNPRNEWNGGN
ncbi:DNA-binding protein [Paraphotobacterium marinum]|uniref:DNA-binding protein n=1 Tax=Paraphotobacterium marinum TaxID=1755811 RepID=A0A220VDX2_9GAMM|nr:DnaJ C-terminal domain-containing protein [Paraphotobacterium marinum]ASK78490.1 DNA-binding protein [Paraphotobacterium marinum]